MLAVSPNSAGDTVVPATLPVKNEPEVKNKVQDTEPQKVAKPKPDTDVKQEPTVKYRSPRKQRNEKPKWDLDSFQVDPLPGKTRFHDFDLPLSLMRAIADLDCCPVCQVVA